MPTWEVRETYNRYNGSTGQFIRLPEPFDEREREHTTYAPPRAPEPHPTRDGARPEPPREQRRPPGGSAPPHRPGQAPPSRPGRPQNRPQSPRPPMQSGGEGSLERLLSGFGGALSGRLGSLNTEDLLLLAIVYLMYRENGDKQLLVVLAALLLF